MHIYSSQFFTSSSSKAIILEGSFFCCTHFLLSQLFFGVICWDALHFQTVASTPNNALSRHRSGPLRSRFLRGNNGGPGRCESPGDGQARLGPRKCWHKSNGEASTSTLPKHMLLQIQRKRKSMNQSTKKNILLERSSLGFLLILNILNKKKMSQESFKHFTLASISI